MGYYLRWLFICVASGVSTTSPSPTTSTNPHVLLCGEQDNGAYTGVPLTFVIEVTQFGTLTFDATESNFATRISSFGNSNSNRSTTDGGTAELIQIVPGTYTFILDGDAVKSTYNITTHCTYANIESTNMMQEHMHNSKIELEKDAMIILAVLLSIIVICFCAYYIYRNKQHQKQTVTVPPIKNYSYENDVNALQIRQATPSVDVTNLMMQPPLQKKTTSIMISNYLKSQVANKISVEDDSSDSSENVVSLEEAMQSGQQDAVDLMTVATWLQLDVKLPQYYNTFVENGYESLEFIKDIQGKEELVQIGIMSKEHQRIIMKCIKMLDENHLMLEDFDGVANIQNGGGGDRSASVYSEGPNEANQPYFSHGSAAVKEEETGILHEMIDGAPVQSDEASIDSDDNEFIVRGDDDTDQGIAINTRF